MCVFQSEHVLCIAEEVSVVILDLRRGCFRRLFVVLNAFVVLQLLIMMMTPDSDDGDNDFIRVVLDILHSSDRAW